MGSPNGVDDADERETTGETSRDRRRFLKGIGALGAAGAAGCLGDGATSPDTETSGNGNGATETDTGTDTETETDTDTGTETGTDTDTGTKTPEPPSDANFSVLVLSVTKGFRHDSIENGNDVLETLIGEIGDEVGEEMTVEFIDNQGPRAVDDFQEAIPSTKQEFDAYDAVVFQNTNGSVLNGDQKSAFREYIEGGGGWMGIHAGVDTHKNWDWYDQTLAAATFVRHPSGVREAEVHVTDRTHPATEHLPARWTRTDEWYDFNRNPRGNTHVLATLDERTYDGAEMNGGFGRDHPIAWCHDVGQGRAFYTGGGHASAVFDEPDFRKHLKGGLMWAAGYAGGDANGTVWENYTEETVVEGANGPMKMDISDDGRLFYTERGGNLKVVDLASGEESTVLSLDVYMGPEDGLQGVALDPDFGDNGYLYVYYSPSDVPGDLETGANHLGTDMGVNRLSRFTFPENPAEIDAGTEQQILDVIVQRNTCCHTGGDLDFDSQGNLYLTTGDDTNPFQSSGRTPIDERDGREPFDAQRSSGNTADLRGAAIRISPNDDGSYDIPDGNLIDAVDTSDTDLVYPELYAIGFRNPFTAAVDRETDTLFLADYGPDAGGWGNRGPMGTVEYAKVDEAGFYGWPFFTGHSVPYREYDFETGETGDIFDPENPTNPSVNNTGLEELPPAEGTMIMSPYNWGGYVNYPSAFAEYVPYSSVDEVPFPQVTGGAPMIGTVFRDSEAYTYQALPASYDGKVFMMEYGANWVKYATLDDEGEVMEVDPFMPDRGFSSPFDMAVGPDGALYIMERGGGTITRFALDSSVLPVDLSVDSQISGGEIFVTKDTPVEVTATVTNDSRTGINDVELGLDSDADVRVSDGNNTSADSVGGGSSLTADWAVTLPGDLASGSYTIEATATYTSNGSEFTLSSSFSFTVTG